MLTAVVCSTVLFPATRVSATCQQVAVGDLTIDSTTFVNDSAAVVMELNVPRPPQVVRFGLPGHVITSVRILAPEPLAVGTYIPGQDYLACIDQDSASVELRDYGAYWVRIGTATGPPDYYWVTVGIASFGKCHLSGNKLKDCPDHMKETPCFPPKGSAGNISIIDTDPELKDAQGCADKTYTNFDQLNEEIGKGPFGGTYTIIAHGGVNAIGPGGERVDLDSEDGSKRLTSLCNRLRDKPNCLILWSCSVVPLWADPSFAKELSKCTGAPVEAYSGYTYATYVPEENRCRCWQAGTCRRFQKDTSTGQMQESKCKCATGN